MIVLLDFHVSMKAKKHQLKIGPGQRWVDNPEHVSVTEIRGKQTYVLELKVAKADTGQVIGKKGQTARAIRTILSTASSKTKKRLVLEIIK